MARYKDYCYEQDKLIPIAFSKQIQPGSFEYTLSYLVDHVIDTAVLDGRYHNDETGAPAYDPALLLKVVLYGYSRGMVSSRELARCCRENVVMMALSADTQPHFTTIAHFVATLSEVIEPLFSDVLWYCEELGLLGGTLFAVDGCKLPSNASKSWSGTKAELTAKRTRLARAAQRLLAGHRAGDRQGSEELERETAYRQRLERQVEKLDRWLATHEERLGASGKPVKSNLTDNDSAKMKTSHGVLQGYTGVAGVDARHQVIVFAQAYGQGQEQNLLLPVVEGIEQGLSALGGGRGLSRATVLADSGFHSEGNLQQLHERGVTALIADHQLRQRDWRFAEVEKYRARSKKETQRHRGSNRQFSNRDFEHDPVRRTCVCPAGKALYRNGANITIGGYRAVKFTAPKRACQPCELRQRCLRDPAHTAVRQVTFFTGEVDTGKFPHTRAMRERIDSPQGQALYARRIGIVEPVFGNHRNHGRERFTLCGKDKVNAQWIAWSMVHNIGKVHRYGEGFSA